MAAVGTMCLPLRRLADGTQATASHTLQHPPAGLPLLPLTPSLGLGCSLYRVSDTSLMWRHSSGINWWLLFCRSVSADSAAWLVKCMFSVNKVHPFSVFTVHIGHIQTLSMPVQQLMSYLSLAGLTAPVTAFSMSLLLVIGQTTVAASGALRIGL